MKIPNIFTNGFIALIYLNPTPSFAQVNIERYISKCEVLGLPSQCEVVDIRTSNGFLDTREIREARFGYTMRQKYIPGVGFSTWDSYSLNTYKFPYQTGQGGESVVSPHLVIDKISWD